MKEVLKEIDKIRDDLAEDLLSEIKRYEPFHMDEKTITPDDPVKAALREYGSGTMNQDENNIKMDPFMQKAIAAWASRNKIKGNIRRT